MDANREPLATHLESHVDGLFQPAYLGEAHSQATHDLLGLLQVAEGEQGGRSGDVEPQEVAELGAGDCPAKKAESHRRALGVGEEGKGGDCFLVGEVDMKGPKLVAAVIIGLEDESADVGEERRRVLRRK